MFYPENFKKRVKKAYPKQEKLHLLLDRENPNLDEIFEVGDILKVGDRPSIPTDEVMKAKSLIELQNSIEEKRALRSIWEDLYLYRDPNR